MVTSTGFEWWLKNQMTSDPEVVERYGITETNRGLRVEHMDDALANYHKQNDRDWKKWREWHTMIKQQQKEAQA